MAYIPLSDSLPVLGYEYNAATGDLHILYDQGQSGTYSGVSPADVEALAKCPPHKRFTFLGRHIGATCGFVLHNSLVPYPARSRTRRRMVLPPLPTPDPR